MPQHTLDKPAFRLRSASFPLPPSLFELRLKIWGGRRRLALLGRIMLRRAGADTDALFSLAKTQSSQRIIHISIFNRPLSLTLWRGTRRLTLIQNTPLLLNLYARRDSKNHAGFSQFESNKNNALFFCFELVKTMAVQRPEHRRFYLCPSAVHSSYILFLCALCDSARNTFLKS